MLHDSAKLGELTLHATDGEIGHVDDVYFSDDTWTIRYLVVDTGGWLTGRKVLISPRAVRSLDFDRGELRLDLTRERIRGAPDFDSEKPVSRQYETEFFGYYGYPHYWTGPYLWGVGEFPAAPGTLRHAGGVAGGGPQRAERKSANGDPHLRSAREVSGYRIEATDGEIGHIETFLFDEASWAIDAIVVDTRNWWPGKHVVVSPHWIEEIDWADRGARVRVSRERIRTSAEYEPQSAATDEGHRQLQERIAHVLHFGD